MGDTIDSEMLFLVVDYLRRNKTLAPAVQQLESLISENRLLGCGQRWDGSSYVRSYEDLIRKFPLAPSVLRDRVLPDINGAGTPPFWLSLAPPRAFPADTIFRSIQNRGVLRRLRTCPPSLYARYRHIKTTYGHHGPVFCVAFDRTGRRIITGSDDHRVKIWRTCDGALEYSLLGHTAPISDIAVSVCNIFVASASADGTVRLWYLRDGSLIRVMEVETEVSRVVFHPEYVVCTTMNGSTHALLLSEASSRQVLTTPSPLEPPRSCEALSVSISPCQQLFAVGYNHGHISFFLFDLLGEGFMNPFSDVDISSAGEIVTVAFARRVSEHSPLRIAAGSHTGKFHILARNSNGLFDIQHALIDTSPFRNYESANLVVILSWASNDSKLVTTYHSSIHVWCTNTGVMLFSSTVHSFGSDILSMSVHPLYTEAVFTVSVDGSAIVSSLIDGSEIAKFPANDTYQLIDCSFSPNGDFICATSDLGRLVLFGTGSRRRHAKLPDSQFFTFENPSSRANPNDLPPRVLCDADFDVFERQPRHLVQCHVARDLSEAESDVDSDLSEDLRPPPMPSIVSFDVAEDILFDPHEGVSTSRARDDANGQPSEIEESFSASSETDNEDEDDVDEILSDEDLESFQIAVSMEIDPERRGPNTRRTRRHDSGSDSDRPLRRWNRIRRAEEAGGSRSPEPTPRRRVRRRPGRQRLSNASRSAESAEASVAERPRRHRRVERAASQQTAQSDRSFRRTPRSDPNVTAVVAESIISRIRARRSAAAALLERQNAAAAAAAAAAAPQRRMSTRRQSVLSNQLVVGPNPASPSRIRTRSLVSSAPIAAARVTRQRASSNIDAVVTPPIERRSTRIPYSDQPLRARRQRLDLLQQQPHQSGSAYNTRTQAQLAAAAAVLPPSGRTTRRSQQSIEDMIASSVTARRTRPRSRHQSDASSDSDLPLRSSRRVRRHVER